MNRRKAFKRILAGGAALIAGVAGFKAVSLFKSPNYATLEQYKDLIAELAETIIPETETPGAKAAGVGPFIIRMVKDCTPVQSQNNFIAGLSDVDSFTQGTFGKAFAECSADERIQAMTHFENEGKSFPGIAGKIERRLAGESFFDVLKKYTVLGYCTSEVGVTQGLSYVYIPGKYEADIPLERQHKAWAVQ